MAPRASPQYFNFSGEWAAEYPKCGKCDERGYISTNVNGCYSGRSCECGWAIEQQEKVFEGVTLEHLLAYGAGRVEEKRRLTSNEK
jgi:hypothetical protein